MTEGLRTYAFDHLLSGETECFVHEQGLFTLYHAGKNVSLTIDPIGMTADELSRAIIAGNTVIERAEAMPNRHDRRAQEVMN